MRQSRSQDCHNTSAFQKKQIPNSKGNAASPYADGPHGPGLQPAWPHGSAVNLDHVLILRLRTVIERCVSAGFGPTLRSSPKRRTARRPLKGAGRGSSSEALARQLAIYLAHVAGGYRYRVAGALFDRDRTTAAHACAVIEDKRDNPNFDRTLAALEPAVRLSLAQVLPAR